MSNVEDYRYFSASAGDLRSLSIPLLSLRIVNFRKTHRKALEFQAAIAGAKLK